MACLPPLVISTWAADTSSPESRRVLTATASRSSGSPLVGVYLWVRGSRQATSAAATMCSGVGKSGSPAPKPMTFSPAALRALALASTAKVAEGETAAIRAEIRRPVMVSPGRGGRCGRGRFLSGEPWCHDSIRDRYP